MARSDASLAGCGRLALVTGGSGMLGSRLARALLAHGFRVRLTCRPGDCTDAVAGLALELCAADLLDEAAMARAVAGVDVVFHVAALVSFDPADYHRQWQVNVEGTRVLLRLAAAAGVRRLVYTSTVNTLGLPAPGQLGDEQTAFDWGGYGLGYMDSKRRAELLVLEAARQGLIDTVAVLPGTLFGPGDVNVNAGRYIRWVARSPRVLPVPPGGTSVVHVDDVAQGHLLALARGRTGRRYVLAGEPMTYGRLFQCIARALGRSWQWTPAIPAGLLLAAGRAGTRLRDLGIPLPLTHGLAVAATAQLSYRSRRAERELGWQHVPGQQAVSDGVRWYRQMGLI